MTETAKRSNDHLQSLFRKFDANGDGLIDETEFSAMIDSLGWRHPVEIVSLEFAAIDSDEDGRVQFREFADWWQDRN